MAVCVFRLRELRLTLPASTLIQIDAAPIRCPVCTAALPELTRLPENFMLNAIIEAMAQCQAQADVPTPEAILLPDGRIRVTWRRRPGAQRANKYQLEEWVDGSASGYAPKDIR